MKYLPLLATLLIFWVGTGVVWGQEKKANDLFEKFRYLEAARIYEKIVSKNDTARLSLERVAFCYSRLKDYKKSELYYAKLVAVEEADSSLDINPAHYVRYGQALKQNGKIREAKEQFVRYYESEPGSFLARLLIQSVEDIELWKLQKPDYKVVTLEGLNSSYSEFSPFPYKGGLVFTTENNHDHVNGTTDNSTGRPYLSVQFAPAIDSSLFSFDKHKPFLKRLNTDFHDGPISIDTVSNTIYYSRVGKAQRGKDFVNTIQTYSALILKDKKIGESVPFFLNSDSFSVAHPAISADGNQLIFSSNMPGGKGNMDLYICTKQDEFWSAPKNLGPAINSPGNEVFPFISAKGELFFSSDGKPGYGGLDLFASRLENGKWLDARNMRTPINSPHDDFGLSFVNDTAGYLSSDRSGSIGSDDIYGFVKLPKVVEDTSLVVDIEGLFEYDNLPAVGIKVKLVDEYDNVIQETTTDMFGKFKFGKLPQNKNFVVLIDEEDNTIPDNLELFLINEAGEKVLLAHRLKKGAFRFKTLPQEKLASLPLLQELDDELTTFEIFGQIFSKLPGDYKDGIEVYALDDKGEIIATAFTDSLGNFKFATLDSNGNYTIKVSDTDSALQAALFNGKEVDTIAVDPIDPRKALLFITGVFEYQSLPVTASKLYLLDENDNIIDSTFTDGKGKFDFGPIAENQKYQVKMAPPIEGAPEDYALYLTDDQDNKLLLAQRIKAGLFAFKSLPLEKFNQLEPIVEAKDLVFDPTKFLFIKGQFEFESLPASKAKLYLLDENDNVIDSTWTDLLGNFSFGPLAKNTEYHVQMAHPPEGRGNITLHLTDEQNNKLKLTRDIKAGKFTFETLPEEEIAGLSSVSENDRPPTYDIFGQLQKADSGTIAPGTKVLALDTNGNIVGLAETDELGNFKFEKLPQQGGFLFQLVENDPDVNVLFMDENGSILESAVRNLKGEFAYETLNRELSQLSSVEENDNQFNFEIFGQLQNETGIVEEGTKVLALDSNGKIIGIAETDGQGNFKFEKLPAEGGFMFKLAEDDPSISLAFTDEEGSIIESAVRNLKGDFAYETLNRQLNDLSELEENESLITAIDKGQVNKLTINKAGQIVASRKQPAVAQLDTTQILRVLNMGIFGQLYQLLPGDFTESVQIFALNDAGEIVAITVTDAFGKFHFEKLDPDQEYLFKLVPNDRGNMQMMLTDEQGEAKDRLVANDGGEFTYGKIAENTDAGPKTDLITKVSEDDRTINYLIYFAFGSWNISTEAKAELDNLITYMEQNPDYFIEVSSHTDSRGWQDYNMVLSERRTQAAIQYMIARGLSSGRVNGFWYGETRPVNDCGNGKWCPLSEHALNRRTEFRIIKNENTTIQN